VKFLIAMLQDEDVVKRWVAAQALGQLREVSAVEPLVAALCDEEENEREAAEDPLEGIGNPEAEQALGQYQEQKSKN
jgi:HEAT repeat protein